MMMAARTRSRNRDVFHAETFSSIIFIGDPDTEPGEPVVRFDMALVVGTGTLNGVPGIRFEATLTDNGEPGWGDLYEIVFPDGESPGVSGNLRKGNHQAHPPEGEETATGAIQSGPIAVKRVKWSR